MRLDHIRRNLAAMAFALTVTVPFLGLPAAFAGGPHQPHPVRVVPVERADGLSGGQLVGRVESRWYSSNGTEDLACIKLGRTGKVVYPGDEETTCTIDEGTSVLNFFGASCDNVIDPMVDPSFYGETEAAQRRCAIKFDRGFVTGYVLTVDDGEPVNIFPRRFEVVTPQQHVWMPEGNFYGITPRPVTLVAHAWAAIVTGLRPGLHTIAFDLTLADGGHFTGAHSVNVVPRHHCS